MSSGDSGVVARTDGRGKTFRYIANHRPTEAQIQAAIPGARTGVAAFIHRLRRPTQRARHRRSK